MNTSTNLGWDSEQQAILAKIRPVIEAELTIVPAPVAKPSPEVVALTELVEKYEVKWPEIRYVKGGSRARKGMEYVLRGDVILVGTDQRGGDVWLVGGHRCSKKGLWCECKDMQAPDILHYGKLCCHRLAVALKTNWHGDQNHALLDYLRSITANDGEFVDVIVQRVYDYHNDGNRAYVAGYWAHGVSKHARLSPSDIIQVSLPQFQWALSQMGWGLIELPIKLPGWSDYYYRIARGDGLLLNEAVFWHRGRTWRMEDRERMRRLDLQQFALHLDDLVNGHFAIKLSSYEAHRVIEIRQKFEAQAITARDVWSALPETLQMSILENGGIVYAN